MEWAVIFRPRSWSISGRLRQEAAGMFSESIEVMDYSSKGIAMQS
jgi:hypothetical protein